MDWEGLTNQPPVILIGTSAEWISVPVTDLLELPTIRCSTKLTEEQE